MTIMQSVKKLFSVLLLAVIVSACSNDDPLARVKYQISGLDSSVAEIRYRNEVGATAVLTTNGDITIFAGGGDSKSINVNFTPFEANLKITVNNTSTSNKEYILKIYEDGEVKATKNYSAPASAISSEEVLFTVE